MKRRIVPLVTFLAALAVSTPAFAHVIVTPGQAGVGQELVFNVSVPNERTTPVTDVRLVIPEGVTSLVPTEKPGWTITTQQDSHGDISSVDWSGGPIPVGQRDDFSFSTQVPGNATDLDWKAYQTYADGTVVHWDQKPAGSDDSTGTAGPYSVTHVVDDLQPTTPQDTANTKADLGIALGGFATLLAALSFVRRR